MRQAPTPGPPSSRLDIAHSVMEGPCGGTIVCADVSNADPLVGGARFSRSTGIVTTQVKIGIGSSAVDAGDTSVCPDLDSNLKTRPHDGDGDGVAVCDIGAEESYPAEITFKLGASSAHEGPAKARLIVELVGTPANEQPLPASAHFVIKGRSAQSDDFVAASGTIEFAGASMGQESSGVVRDTDATIEVVLKDDFLVENPETVIVGLSDPKGAILGLTRVHVLTIVDNEPRLKCQGAAATMVGSPGADVIPGTPGRDVIVGRGGNDRIRAGAGNDVICASAGDDLVRAAAGDDRVLGNNGDDRLFGGAGSDDLRGGGAADTISGGAGDDFLAGQRGKDDLRGETGRDRLSGGPGAGDTCDGGAGTDALLAAHGCESTSGVP